MYCAAASRQTLSHSAGAALRPCTTAATRSAGAATGTQFSVAGSTCGCRPWGSPADGLRERRPFEAGRTEESVDCGDRDHDADHLDVRERIDAAFELVLVPALGQRRRMTCDPVDGIDHHVGQGHVGGSDRPALVGDTHGGSGSASSSASRASWAIAARSAPVHDAPGDVT